MKTDDLITVLAQEPVPEPGALPTLQRVMPVCVAVVGLLFFNTLGLRHDVGTASAATAMKLAVTLTLAITGLFVVRHVLKGATVFQTGSLLLLAGALLAVFSIVDVVSNGAAGAGARMIGSKGLHCMMLVPLFSALPLAAILLALRRGLVFAPRLAGLAAGVAASGIGASFYALNCTDDSPLFLLLWYTLAVAMVSGFAMLISPRLLRW